MTYEPFMAHGAQALVCRIDAALQKHAGKTLAQMRAAVDAGIDTHAVSIAVDDAIRVLNDDLEAALEAEPVNDGI